MATRRDDDTVGTGGPDGPDGFDGFDGIDGWDDTSGPEDATGSDAAGARRLIRWHEVEVEGQVAHYGDAGDGLPLLFLHGWALSNRTYVRALRHLLDHDVRILVPALPGFGGTAELPEEARDIGGYASWVAAFLDAVGVEEPAVVAGHSFGGGVAIALAHAHPDRARALVLLNSIGGSAWTRDEGVVRAMAERPLWDWGLHFSRDLLPVGQVRNVLPVILRDAVPNLLRRPRAFWHAARIARSADLTDELETLRTRGLPIVVLWGEEDRIVPEAATSALVEALGEPHLVTVPGRHNWLLADPESFGEVMTNVLAVATATGAEESERPRPPWWRRRGRAS